MQTGLLSDGFLVRASAFGSCEICFNTFCSSNRALKWELRFPACVERGALSWHSDLCPCCKQTQ